MAGLASKRVTAWPAAGKVRYQPRQPHTPMDAAELQRFRALEDLAKNGDLGAMLDVAALYVGASWAIETTGIQNLPPDAAAAMHWAQQAVALDHSAAWNLLGWLHREGPGIPYNPVAAATCYGEAIARGSQTAAANLAVLYEYGEGVPRDPHRAVLLALRADAQILGRVWHDLASIFVPAGRDIHAGWREIIDDPAAAQQDVYGDGNDLRAGPAFCWVKHANRGVSVQYPLSRYMWGLLYSESEARRAHADGCYIIASAFGGHEIYLPGPERLVRFDHRSSGASAELTDTLPGPPLTPTLLKAWRRIPGCRIRLLPSPSLERWFQLEYHPYRNAARRHCLPRAAAGRQRRPGDVPQPRF